MVALPGIDAKFMFSRESMDDVTIEWKGRMVWTSTNYGFVREVKAGKNKIGLK